jgi:hypothetical protein
MLNAPDTPTSDMPSESGSHYASTAAALPSSHDPSPHRPGRLARSKSAYCALSPKVPDPWATTLAAIREFSSPPHQLRNSSDPSGRPASAGVRLRPRETDGGDIRTCTVTVVEDLPNSLFALRWHDPTHCHYAEQVWVPSRARSLGRCALSGKNISLGDPVYRPQTRARAKPLNLDAMILASEMIKARTGA